MVAVEYKKLEDVCDITYYDRLHSNDWINGDYTVFSPTGFDGSHNTFNVDENVIICPYYAWSNIFNKTSDKVFASDAFTIKPKNSDIIDNDYLYKFLISSRNNFLKMYAYDGIIDKCLINFMVPIVSMSLQKQIDDTFFSSLNVPFDEEYVNKIKKERLDAENAFYYNQTRVTQQI